MKQFELYYQRNPNFFMEQKDAAKLTLFDLLHEYSRVGKGEIADEEGPDEVFSMY